MRAALDGPASGRSPPPPGAPAGAAQRGEDLAERPNPEGERSEGREHKPQPNPGGVATGRGYTRGTEGSPESRRRAVGAAVPPWRPPPGATDSSGRGDRRGASAAPLAPPGVGRGAGRRGGRVVPGASPHAGYPLSPLPGGRPGARGGWEGGLGVGRCRRHAPGGGGGSHRSLPVPKPPVPLPAGRTAPGLQWEGDWGWRGVVDPRRGRGWGNRCPPGPWSRLDPASASSPRPAGYPRWREAPGAEAETTGSAGAGGWRRGGKAPGGARTRPQTDSRWQAVARFETRLSQGRLRSPEKAVRRYKRKSHWWQRAFAGRSDADQRQMRGGTSGHRESVGNRD